jgi:hypothetical protein
MMAPYRGRDILVDMSEFKSQLKATLNMSPPYNRSLLTIAVYNAGLEYVEGHGFLLIPTAMHKQCFYSTTCCGIIPCIEEMGFQRSKAKISNMVGIYWSRLYYGWFKKVDLMAFNPLTPRHVNGPILGTDTGYYLRMEHVSRHLADVSKVCKSGRNMPSGSQDSRVVSLKNGTEARRYFLLVSQYECMPHLKMMVANLYLYRVELKQMRLQLVWPPVHLQQASSKGKNEKNWVLFDFEAQLYASVRMQPHRVVLIPIGFWVGGNASRVTETQTLTVGVDAFDTSSPLLDAIQQEFGFISGGSQAIRVAIGDDKKPRYLAAVHIKPNGTYMNFIVAFTAKPPFAVEYVSRKLPLQCLALGDHDASGMVLGVPYGMPYSSRVPATSRQCVSYAIGLKLVDDQLVSSYGAGDVQSRLWLIEWEHFETSWLTQNAASLIDDLRATLAAPLRTSRNDMW